jgi:hypothetical protein
MGARREWVLLIGWMSLGRAERLGGGLVDGGGGKCGFGDERPWTRACVEEEGVEAALLASRLVLLLLWGLLTPPFSQFTCEGVTGDSRLLWEDDGVWE